MAFEDNRRDPLVTFMIILSCLLSFIYIFAIVHFSLRNDFNRHKKTKKKLLNKTEKQNVLMLELFWYFHVCVFVIYFLSIKLSWSPGLNCWIDKRLRKNFQSINRKSKIHVSFPSPGPYNNRNAMQSATFKWQTFVTFEHAFFCCWLAIAFVSRKHAM